MQLDTIEEEQIKRWSQYTCNIKIIKVVQRPDKTQKQNVSVKASQCKLIWVDSIFHLLFTVYGTNIGGTLIITVLLTQTIKNIPSTKKSLFRKLVHLPRNLEWNLFFFQSTKKSICPNPLYFLYDNDQKAQLDSTSFYPFPKRQILDSSELKEFAYTTISNLMKMAEISPFPSVFSKECNADT